MVSVSLALVFLVAALIWTIREKTWLMSGFIFVTGVFFAATGWGHQIVDFLSGVGSWAQGMINKQ